MKTATDLKQKALHNGLLQSSSSVTFDKNPVTLQIKCYSFKKLIDINNIFQVHFPKTVWEAVIYGGHGNREMLRYGKGRFE